MKLIRLLIISMSFALMALANSFTEIKSAIKAYDFTNADSLIENYLQTPTTAIDPEIYLLKKKISLLFLKYLIICLTSSSLKIDDLVFTNISRYSAACKISLEDLPNLLANSKTFNVLTSKRLFYKLYSKNLVYINLTKLKKDFYLQIF